jgi:hypothetical protein
LNATIRRRASARAWLGFSRQHVSHRTIQSRIGRNHGGHQGIASSHDDNVMLGVAHLRIIFATPLYASE